MASRVEAVLHKICNLLGSVINTIIHKFLSMLFHISDDEYILGVNWSITHYWKRWWKALNLYSASAHNKNYHYFNRYILYAPAVSLKAALAKLRINSSARFQHNSVPRYLPPQNQPEKQNHHFLRRGETHAKRAAPARKERKDWSLRKGFEKSCLFGWIGKGKTQVVCRNGEAAVVKTRVTWMQDEPGEWWEWIFFEI